MHYNNSQIGKGSIFIARFDHSGEYGYLHARPLIAVSHFDHVSKTILAIPTTTKNNYPGVVVSILNTHTGLPIGNNSYSTAQPYHILPIKFTQIISVYGVLDRQHVSLIDKCIDYHLGRTEEIPEYFKNEKLNPLFSVPTSRTPENYVCDLANDMSINSSIDQSMRMIDHSKFTNSNLAVMTDDTGSEEEKIDIEEIPISKEDTIPNKNRVGLDTITDPKIMKREYDGILYCRVKNKSGWTWVPEKEMLGIKEEVQKNSKEGENTNMFVTNVIEGKTISEIKKTFEECAELKENWERRYNIALPIKEEVISIFNTKDIALHYWNILDRIEDVKCKYDNINSALSEISSELHFPKGVTYQYLDKYLDPKLAIQFINGYCDLALMNFVNYELTEDRIHHIRSLVFGRLYNEFIDLSERFKNRNSPHEAEFLRNLNDYQVTSLYLFFKDSRNFLSYLDKNKYTPAFFQHLNRLGLYFPPIR